MIDTICLLIPKNSMSYLTGIVDWKLYSATDEYEKYIRNPSKLNKGSGKYFPRLTGYKRLYREDANVRIEFSVPKLLYLNNLDELEESDFPEVICILQNRLKTMGIIINKTTLENASVSSLHFSKNILLQDGYTASHLISEMNKIDIRKTFDFAKTKFTNDGQSLYAHTTSHQLVIYDKIADMGKSKKRAMDKDQTTCQMNLFDTLKEEKELQEIIRFEIRINKKQKLNSLLESLGYQKNPVFRQVFSVEMSKKVVTSYWQKLIKERNFGLFSLSMSNKDILQTLFLADKEMKAKQAVYLFGLFQLARDENGMRQLRAIVSKRSHDRTWYRITKHVQQATELITKNKVRSWVTQIDSSLDDYKPYKIKNYETKKNDN